MIEVEERYRLDVREVSGLGWRRHPRRGVPELLAVSDAQDTLVRARRRGGRLEVTRREVRGLPRHLRSRHRVEWEAVAGDAAGRVLVVHEAGSGLLVLAPDLSFEQEVALRHDWRADAHHGPESLVLLRSGHVLTAKQEDPVVLVELAPAGSRAAGFGPDRLLGPDEAFAVPEHRAELHQVGVWRLPATAGLASINDLAVDDAGRVLALSSRSRRVARLEAGGPDDAQVRVTASWTLDVGRLLGTEDRRARAEGLLVHPALGSFVAVDTEERDAAGLVRVTGPWTAGAGG